MSDLAGLIIESKPMFAEMGFEAYGNAWEYESMVEWWTDVLTKPAFDIIVARENQRIVGVSVVAYTNKFFWHKGPLHANELAHHAAPDLSTVARCRIMITMLDAILEKVKAKGTEYFKIGYDPKPEFAGWGRYLQKRGFIDSSHVLVTKVDGL